MTSAVLVGCSTCFVSLAAAEAMSSGDVVFCS